MQEPNPDKYVAVCSTCGYVGLSQPEETDAGNDGDEHVIQMVHADPGRAQHDVRIVHS